MRTEESDLPSIYTNLSKMAPDNKNIQYLNIIVFSYNSPKSPPDKGDPGLNRQKKNPENLLISLLLSLCTFETKGTRKGDGAARLLLRNQQQEVSQRPQHHQRRQEV